MFIIGERINAMFKSVNEAFKNHDESFVREIAISQIRSGAKALDLSLGTEFKDSFEKIGWLIETVKDIDQVELSIDSPKIEIIEHALKILKKPAIINSSTAHDEKLEKYIELAKKYNSKLIVLTMDEKGLPQSVEGRIELIMKIIQTSEKMNFRLEDVLIDPLVMPVNVAQNQAETVIRTIREIQILTEPAIKTVCGLSNFSQGAANKKLLNRTYVSMLIEAGLYGAIMYPLDSELMETVKASEIITGKNIYCDSFLTI